MTGVIVSFHLFWPVDLDMNQKSVVSGGIDWDKSSHRIAL